MAGPVTTFLSSLTSYSGASSPSLDSLSFSSITRSYHRARVSAHEDAAPAAILEALLAGEVVAELFDDMVSHLVCCCYILLHSFFFSNDNM
jgi:hypothetical protein